MRRTIAAAVALVTLAACGNDDEPTVTPSPAPTPTDPTLTPTPAEPETATVAQYASLIAEHEGGWRESVATIEDTCTDPDAIPICAATYLTASFQAETLALDLSGAGDEIGEPPTEIADLLADTGAAASAYADAYEAWSATGCEDPLDLECGVSESFEMGMALDELTEKFDAWEPYT